MIDSNNKEIKGQLGDVAAQAGRKGAKAQSQNTLTEDPGLLWD